MDCPGDNFFSCTGLTGNQYGKICPGNTLTKFPDMPDLWIIALEIFKSLLFLHPLSVFLLNCIRLYFFRRYSR